MRASNAPAILRIRFHSAHAAVSTNGASGTSVSPILMMMGS